MINQPLWVRVVAVNGFLVVALGAFAAHALDARLTDAQSSIFETAVFYHCMHTLALLGLLNVTLHPRRQLWIACLFTFGIVVFCGSLYAFAITDVRQLVWVTPLGGSAFILGWLLLFVSTSVET